MKKIGLCITFLCLAFLVRAQVSLTDINAPVNINTCDTGLFSFEADILPLPTVGDSVTFTITLPVGVGFGSHFATSSGSIFVRSLVANIAQLTVFPSSGTFVVEYVAKPGCQNFQLSTQNVSNQVIAGYRLFTGTLSTGYSINSPILGYVGYRSPQFASPFVPYTRTFVFTNQGSTHFNGDIAFTDTLYNSLNHSGVNFDNIQIIHPGSITVLGSQANDTSLFIHAGIFNLQPGDSVVIEETLTLTNCNLHFADNKSFAQLSYGCNNSSLQQLCALAPNTFALASIEPNPSQPHLFLDMLDPNQLLGPLVFSCPASADHRIIRMINNGGAATDSIQVSLQKSATELGEIGYFDTNEVKVFYYVGNTRQYIHPTWSQVSNYNFWSPSYDLQTNATPDIYTFKLLHPLVPGDSIFVEYEDRNFCVGSPGFPRVYNQATIMHSVRFFGFCKYSCNNTWVESDLYHTTSRGVWGILSQRFEQAQFFQNFHPYLNNAEEEWYDVVNLTPLQMNLNHPYFLDEIEVDPAKCELVYELTLDSGVVLVTDSIYLLSQPSNILWPVSITDNATSGTGGLVRAVFHLPANFFAPNLVGAHSTSGAHWVKTNAYHQFFSNSSVHFKLKALCSLSPYDSKSEITERALFVYDNTCGSGCEIPLAEKESLINLLCPGCLVPGWNIGLFDLQRKNFGWEDVDDNNRPDQVALVHANAATAEEDHITQGDTLEIHLKSNASDGNVILFSNIGFPFKYGWLEFTGDMVPDIQFVEGEGVWRGANINLPASLAAFSNDSLFIDVSPGTLQLYATGQLDTMFWAGDTMDLTLRFVVVSNLIFNNSFITNQQIDCKQHMSGIARTNPAMIGDAGPDESIIGLLPANVRKDYFYWCTGNGGSILAFGHDHRIRGYGSAYGQYMQGNSVVQDYCYKQVQANIGNKMGQLHSSTNYIDATNQFALNAFQYEIRDFMQIDSISFVYPSQSYFVDSIYIYQYNLRSDPQTNNTNFTNYCLQCGIRNFYVYPVNLSRQSGDTVVIYPKLYTQYLPTTGHPFYEADTLSRGDESKVLVPTILLKMIDYCNTPDQIDVSHNRVHAWLSDMPVQGGQVMLTDTMNGDVYFQGDFIKPVPEFSYSASPQPLITSTNPVTWHFTMHVDAQPASNNLSSYEAGVRSVAPNNFIGAYSPSGNINVYSIVPTTIPLSNSYVYAPISIAPLPIVYKIGNLDPSSGTLAFDVNATFNCANINTVDSLYIITGYNCYEYPTSLSNVCGLDTTVVYLQPNQPGLVATATGPTSVSPCDTMDFIIDLDVTGLGNIPHAEVYLTLPPNVQFVAGSGELSFTYNNSQVIIPNFAINGNQFNLNSVSQMAAGINQSFNPIQLKFKLRTLCDYNLENISATVSAVSYCSEPIVFTLPLTPATLLPGTVLADDFTVSNFICNTGQVAYNIQFANPTAYTNAVFLQLPPPFVFTANGQDTLSVIYPPNSSGNILEQLHIMSSNGLYPCGTNVQFNLTALSAQELICTPFETPCTTSNVVTQVLSCSYLFDNPAVGISVGSGCPGGCTPLTSSVTGGQTPYQFVWTNISTATQISTTTNANACPTSSAENIELVVTDVYGCQGTATIQISPCCTPAILTCHDTIIPYNQDLCIVEFTPNPPDISSTCTIISITNDWPGGPFPIGTTPVVWTVTDVNGNISTCTQLVTYDPTTMLMSYTILAGRTVRLQDENRVISGAVGVYNTTLGASFGVQTSVNGPGHFVLAPVIVAATPALVPIQMIGFVNAAIIPPFINNSATGSNIVLSGNVNLPAGNYGIIHITAGSNVTVTGSSIHAYRIMTLGPNTTITFTQPTDVIITEWMHLAQLTNFNPTQEDVKVYVGGFTPNANGIPTIKVGPLSRVNGFLFTTQGRLHVENGNSNIHTEMIGQFIGRYVTSDKYVDWNANPDCSDYRMLNLGNDAGGTDSIMVVDFDPTNGLLTLVPNPASDEVQINFMLPEPAEAEIHLYDMQGKLVEVVWNGTTTEGSLQRVRYDVSTLAAGMYHVVLYSGSKVMSAKLVVTGH